MELTRHQIRHRKIKADIAKVSELADTIDLLVKQVNTLSKKLEQEVGSRKVIARRVAQNYHAVSSSSSLDWSKYDEVKKLSE